MSCGADLEANALLTSLLAGVSFALPAVDLSDPEYTIPTAPAIGTLPVALTNEDLTSRTVNGTGTFDALMAGFAAHLQDQLDKNRITGEQYAKMYTTLTETAMGNAVQYLLGKDQAYWQAVSARYQAQAAEIAVVVARIQAQTAKAQLIATQFEAKNQEATYALTKLKLSTEDMTYCTAKYQLENLLPAQLVMVQEQGEAQRAQTMDTRSDGLTPIAGQVGKQKDLYTQQITSYQRDAEVKAGKMFVDAWITMKTIDEAVLPPTGFTNASLDTVLTAIKVNNNLD